MANLRIRLFQRCRFASGGREVDGFAAQKNRELLCFLLIQRNRAHHRELLASQIWEHGSAATAKKNLRQALWQINSSLPESMRADGNGLLTIDREWVQINMKGEVWLDVEEFERVYEIVKGTSGRQLTVEQASRVELAVDLYTGHLLEGWYQGWCIYERERLHNIYLMMLDKLLGFAEDHGHYDMGLTYGALALRSDPARERTHRRLMRLHYLADHRSLALKQYKACVIALQAELGVEPSAKTRRLYSAICAERSLAHVNYEMNVSSPDVTTQKTVSNPDTLCSMIESLQSQVDQLKDQMLMSQE